MERLVRAVEGIDRTLRMRAIWEVELELRTANGSLVRTNLFDVHMPLMFSTSSLSLGMQADASPDLTRQMLLGW